MRISSLVVVFTALLLSLQPAARAQLQNLLDGPLPDIALAADDAHVEEVEVTVSAHDPALLDLIVSDAARVAIEAPGLTGIHAGPGWHEPLPLLTEPNVPDSDGPDAAPGDPVQLPEPAYDVIVNLMFGFVDADALDAVVARVVERLGSAWYAASAEPIMEHAVGDGAGSGSTNGDGGARTVVTLRQVGVRLAPIDVARAYWKVRVPVMIALDTVDISPFGTLWQWFPRLFDIAYRPASSDGVQVEPFLDILYVHGGLANRLVATGYVPVTDAADSVSVVADAHERIEETDETNNRADIDLAPTPGAAQDIAVGTDTAQVGQISVAAAPGSPQLLEVIRNLAMRQAYGGGVPAHVTVARVFHPNVTDSTATSGVGSGDPGETPVAPWPSPAYDLVVHLETVDGQAFPEALVEALVAALEAEWYCTAAARFDILAETAAAAGDGGAGAIGDLAPEIYPLPVDIGVRLTHDRSLHAYWRVEALLRRETAWWVRPAPLPVAVDVELTAGDGEVRKVTEAVLLPPAGETLFAAYLPVLAPTDRLEGTLAADADERVEEWDEDNNRAAFAWERPPPPEEDLLVHCPGVRNRLVACTAAADNPVLLGLVRHAAVNALADADGFLTTRVFPWSDAAAGLEQIVDVPDVDFDLVVIGVFAGAVASDELSAQLAGALGEQWYAEYVLAADAVAGWPALMDVPHANLPWSAAVALVKLSDTEEVRRYWQIVAPVARRGMSETGTPPTFDELPRLGWRHRAAAWAAAVSGREAEPVPPPDFHRDLLAVDFVGQFDTADGTVEERLARTHVWLAPGHRTRAVGYVEVAGDPAEGSVFVDPDDVIAEADETNNVCVFQADRLTPRGQFRARLTWTAPDTAGSTDGFLTVTGALSNRTDQALHLQFDSALQLDYRLGDFYRWSEDKVFPQVLTRMMVAPGSTVEWTITTPLAELGWDGAETVAEVFLVGTEYTDTCPFPPPGGNGGTGGDESDGESAPGGDDDGLPDDIIVGPNGADLAAVLGEAATQILGGVVMAPVAGDLGDADWRYTAQEDFQGEDYLVVDAAGNDGEVHDAITRLSVGLQAFRLPLHSGWNLVSFPIEPIDGLDELLSHVPGGVAWAFRDGAFETATEARVGEGVWIHCARDAALEFLGAPAAAPVLQLLEGWNLVGPVNGIDFSQIPQIRSVQAWDGRRYHAARRAASGHGRWVFASEPVRIPLP